MINKRNLNPSLMRQRKNRIIAMVICVVSIVFVISMLILLIISTLNKTISNSKPDIRYIGFKVYDPVYIAKDKGFFDKHNVNVEIIDLVSAGPTALQAVSGGSAEACLSSYMAIISARAQGLPVIAVSDIQSAIGEQPLEEFFVRKDSGISSIADLKGKTIAINLVKSSFHYTWLMALEAAGLYESDIDITIMPFEQQELALANGHVDAIGLMQPYVLHAKEKKDLTTLYTALDVFGEKQFCTHVVNNIWAENNKELTEGFVTAIAEAVEWIEANQEEAKTIISKYTGIEIQYIEDYHFQRNAAVIIEDAQFWLDYMRNRNEINADWLQVDDFATNKYNQIIR